MSHASTFMTVNKREDIMPAAEYFAACNVDRQENFSGDYHGNMTIHDKIICESYEDAEEHINNWDNGWYDDHAVQFKDKTALKPTKAMLNLKARMEKNRADKSEYAKAHSVKGRKSEFAGCKKCGSKVAIEYLHGERCPVCGADLRAEYIVERLNKYDADYRDMQKQYEKMEKNQKGKCPTLWLVKVEVHC